MLLRVFYLSDKTIDLQACKEIVNVLQHTMQKASSFYSKVSITSKVLYLLRNFFFLWSFYHHTIFYNTIGNSPYKASLYVYLCNKKDYTEDILVNALLLRIIINRICENACLPLPNSFLCFLSIVAGHQ